MSTLRSFHLKTAIVTVAFLVNCSAFGATKSNAVPAPPPPVAPAIAPPVTPQAAPQATTDLPAAPSPATTAATSAPTTPPATTTLSGPQIIKLLDQTIDWYRTLGIQQQAANEPSDLLILYDNRQTANRVVALAFDIARDNAELLATAPVQTQSQQPADHGAAGASSQTLAQLQNKFAAQAITVQTELDADQRALPKANAKEAVDLKAKISELQGEMDLIGVRKSLLATMATFATESDSSGVSAGALKAQIDAMAITMPAGSNGGSANVAAAGSGAAPAAAASPPAPSAPSSAAVASPGVAITTSFGIWDLVSNVFRLSGKISTIDGVDRRTAALQTTFANISAPLIERLKAMSARGDSLAAQADTADAGTLNQVRDELNALADQFKETSTPLLPLSKEGVLLNQYRRNLANWRELIEGQYHTAWKTLGVRLAILAAVLAVIFAAAELWRRAVTRYVRDARRRYQFMLLRRIALWTLVVVVIGFAFASELGSIVTFAGLITAGVAVAMQSVLVSIVGYFFLIGKYGIRVGDRVQIGEVTGEVIELGLVRLHLAELGGHGLSGPTGRVVAFANSIVFTVSSGLFKQIPGVNFAWHEISLALPAGVDYSKTKERLIAAVTNALKDSRDEIIRQTREIEKTTSSSSAGDASPQVQLAFSATGVEAHIRYPVHLSNAAAIDERVSQELSNVVTGSVPVPGPVQSS